MGPFVIASVAKQSSAASGALDCRVATLLAMTVGITFALHPHIIVILNSFQDLIPLATNFRLGRPGS